MASSSSAAAAAFHQRFLALALAAGAAEGDGDKHQQSPGPRRNRREPLLRCLEAGLARVSAAPPPAAPGGNGGGGDHDVMAPAAARAQAALAELVLQERVLAAVVEEEEATTATCPEAEAATTPPLLTAALLQAGGGFASGAEELLAELAQLEKAPPTHRPCVLLREAPIPRPRAPPPPPKQRYQYQQRPQQQQPPPTRPSSSGSGMSISSLMTGGGNSSTTTPRPGGGPWPPSSSSSSMRAPPIPTASSSSSSRPFPPPPPQQQAPPPPPYQQYASKFATAGEVRNRDFGPGGRKRPLGASGGGPPPTEAPGRRHGSGGNHHHYQQQPAPPQQQQASSGPGFLSSRLGGGGGQQPPPSSSSSSSSVRPYMPPQRGRDPWGRDLEGQEGGQENEAEQRRYLQEQQAGFNPRVMKKYVPPTKPTGDSSGSGGGAGGGPNIRNMVRRAFAGPAGGKKGGGGGEDGKENEGEGAAELPEELQGCDPVLVERIQQEIIDRGDPVTFDDIAGLGFQKKTVVELVCWPLERPDLFTGLRALPRGLLLFGPPGTGKTLIGKAISKESGATFFNISASSLTSKWIGEGEKMVRTLFKVAAYMQPSIIFIDEVDSLLCQRSSEENEASRRLKTEFLVQLDGCGSSAEDRILVVGATNRPQELDEAARRRFVKKLYIPLPNEEARAALVTLLLRKNSHGLSGAEVAEVVRRTAGYSGADIKALCTEAAMGPIRDMAGVSLGNISAADVPDIEYRHFQEALDVVRPSVSQKDLGLLHEWNSEFGTFPRSGLEEGMGDKDKENAAPPPTV